MNFVKGFSSIIDFVLKEIANFTMSLQQFNK